MIDIRTEVFAGVTTFVTMSYIIVVNPSILSTPGTGMNFSGVMTATILVSFLSTLLMGAFAKLPFALAPGMGLNAFFTFSLILGEKIPWPQALGLVFWSGIFFLIISITPMREMIAQSIPKHLRLALSCGIGLFLTFIGLKNAMMIEANPVTFVTHAKLSGELGLSLIGLLIMVFLLKRKNPAGFLIGIISVTLLGLLFGKVSLPAQIFAKPDFSSHFFKMDLVGSLHMAYIPAILTLIATDLFDSLSTFIGVAHAADMLDEKGGPKNIKSALLVDAIATTCSGLFGTSAATTYIESSAGAEVGGRTGLTSIVTALCFLPFLFLGPLASMIPAYATAPVLILVGAMMFKNVQQLDFSGPAKSVPTFLIIVLIPLTFSITQGILWGLVTHVVLHLILGKHGELGPISVVLGLLSGALLFIHS